MNESFPDATSAEVDDALLAASKAFPAFRRFSGKRRATFLEAIADGLERDAEEIIGLAESETSLGLPRLETELRRTSAQARLFAELARSETWREPRSDKGEPNRQPIPKPAMQSRNVSLGPIVVIGACNFPLAISVVGTDTISALAVGCPVVVKAHPGHPATCEKLGSIAREATDATDMPPGTFALLHGESHRVGRELVEHPFTKAVAFTGSLQGGRALAMLASFRPEPIPFYGEMGSLNPLYILPGALRDRGDEIARGYIGAFTLFAGQMCTKPGILATLDDPELQTFLAVAAETIQEHSPVAMLNPGIRDNFEASMVILGEKAELVAKSEKPPDHSCDETACRLFATDASTFLADPVVRTEAFGPASLILRVRSEEELIQLARKAEGSLTASLHIGEGDEELVDTILPILERKAGRVLWNGFPPGVVPTPSTHHGGPWPATTDSRHTSIGLYGYRRFVRPVCYQGFPADE